MSAAQGWRIVEADLWDRTRLDLAGPAAVTFGEDGQGELAFGALAATLALQYSQSMLFFRWHGFDEGDEVTGSGSAEIDDDGMIEIEFAYDNGDEAVLRGRRE